MKFTKKMIALTAAALAVCMTLASCSAQREETGVADEKDMKISTAADLDGKAVAVQLRSAADEYVTDKKLTKYPKRYADMETAMQDLIDKKVAAVVVDSHYAQMLYDKFSGKDDVKIKIVKKSIGSVEYRFQLNRSDAKLVEKLNAGIAALKESEEYTALVKSELTDGKRYEVTKDPEKELKKTFTLVTEPSFAPFTYKSKDKVRGLFVSIADAAAYSCGATLDVKTVEPVCDISNEAATVGSTGKNALCVVTKEAQEDNGDFITTDVFYTSELVMIIRG